MACSMGYGGKEAVDQKNMLKLFVSDSKGQPLEFLGHIQRIGRYIAQKNSLTEYAK